MDARMISLLVIGGVLLIFAIILICPVILDLRFQDDLLIRVRILGIPFRVFQEKETDTLPIKKKEKEREKKGKLSKIKVILERKGVSGLFELIMELKSIVTGIGRNLFSHVVVYRLSLDIAVSNEDAAQTALQYGQACAVIYPTVNAIQTVTKCKITHVCVIADFEEKESKADFHLTAGIRPIFVIIAGIGSFLKLIKVYRKHIAKSSNH